jgi:hypothetical protein
MNKNVILYGLIAVGGLLAYNAWRKKTSKPNSNNTSESIKSEEPTKIDTSQGNYYISEIPEKFKSQISEPLISTQQQAVLTNQSQLFEA